MYYIYNISNIFLYPKNASICSISRSGLRMVAPNPWAALGPSAPTTGTGCLAPRTAPSVPRRAIIQSSSDALRCWWTRWNMRFRIHEYIYIYYMTWYLIIYRFLWQMCLLLFSGRDLRFVRELTLLLRRRVIIPHLQNNRIMVHSDVHPIQTKLLTPAILPLPIWFSPCQASIWSLRRGDVGAKSSEMLQQEVEEASFSRCDGIFL